MSKALFILIFIAIFAIATTIIACTYFYYSNQQEMARQGYEQVIIQGNLGVTRVVWQKKYDRAHN